MPVAMKRWWSLWCLFYSTQAFNRFCDIGSVTVKFDGDQVSMERDEEEGAEERGNEDGG